jgi:hypothetical protein
MSEQSSAERELARLTRDYHQAIEDVMALDLDEITRIARLLEVEARYQGMMEACREALGQSQSSRAARQ